MRSDYKIGAIGSALLVILPLSACGGGGQSSAESSVEAPAETFTASGVLRDRTLPGFMPGDKCDGPNVFNLQDGYEFKIEAEGKTVAMGKLPSGKFSDEGGNFCEFEFSVEGVPAGLKFYTIDLGERNGHKEFSEEEMKTGVITETEDFEGGL